MKTNPIKLLTVTTWAALAISALLLAVAWFVTPQMDTEPKMQAEYARIKALTDAGELKANAKSLADSFHELVQLGSNALRVAQVFLVVFIVLSALNVIWIRRLTKAGNETRAA